MPKTVQCRVCGKLLQVARESEPVESHQALHQSSQKDCLGSGQEGYASSIQLPDDEDTVSAHLRR